MTNVSDFQYLTDIEHVRKRHDIYIGPIKCVTEDRWVIEGDRIEKSEVDYNPGLEQCILELLTNASDHAERCRSKNIQPFVKMIKVDMNQDSITVWNDGKGIPIEIHPDTHQYVPEMIFGSLRTSSNYDDNQKKTWGGKNGIGAKAANIFSTKFVLDIQTGGVNYLQTFADGMTKSTTPIVKKKSGPDYVQITYYPDFKAFEMQDFSSNLTNVLIEKRCYDIAATVDVAIVFNSQKIPIKNFGDYMKLFIGDAPKVVYKTDRWEIGIARTPFDDPIQVSFVNSICTDEGGTHVNHVLDPIVKAVIEMLKEKHKDLTIRPQYIKNNIILFVKALIDNPGFNSQQKRKLETKVSEFGSRCNIPPEVIKKITKLDITTNVIETARMNDIKKTMKSIDGTGRFRKHQVKKLEDANWAGTSKSKFCTLILTEGDSAKALAMNGIPATKEGYDTWGVFPLRGKFLNVRSASLSQIENNEEIKSINQIIGLRDGMTAKDVPKLRYGKVMLMTDQDTDGFHIKGLLMNYFIYFWPEIVKTGFIESMITPVVKIFKDIKVVQQFYNLDDFNKWTENNPTKGLQIKYYKGLGTSKKSEAKEYFTNLATNRIRHPYKNEYHAQVYLAFDKDMADSRKEWITKALQHPQEIDYNIKDVPINKFIDQELVQFSIYDNIRSIPNMIDGLKPSQRKVLYTCLHKNIFRKNMKKVTDIAGEVSSMTAYHHGETSLHGTIIGMAQDFVGAGNLNLLEPEGTFGSRQKGGLDAAQPRYLSTFLKNYTPLIFNKYDNKLLKYLDDEGKSIEPEYFVPIIPMLLINGSTGIGTGWSTNVPCYRVEDLITSIKLLLEDEDAELPNLNPWYRGFKGIIEKRDAVTWISYGKFEVLDDFTIEVTEIPVGMWIQGFKDHLAELCEKDIIISYTQHSTKNDTADDIMMRIEFKDQVPDDDQVIKLLKLSKPISSNNIIAFNHNSVINKYGSAEDVLWEFYVYRLEFYKKRKVYLEDCMEKEIEILNERMRFISMVVDEKIVIFKRSKAVIQDNLAELGFKNIQNLLSLKIHEFTKEDIEKYRMELEEQEKLLSSLKAKTHKDLWNEDLDQLLKEL